MSNPINSLIREVKERLNDTARNLYTHANDIHRTSTENIATNADGIDDLGTVSSDVADSIDDLGELISAIDERLTAIESTDAKEETNG